MNKSETEQTFEILQQMRQLRKARESEILEIRAKYKIEIRKLSQLRFKLLKRSYNKSKYIPLVDYNETVAVKQFGKRYRDFNKEEKRAYDKIMQREWRSKNEINFNKHKA